MHTCRFSGDYTDSLGQLQSKSGQTNNGYVPYVDYARDYSPPPHQTLTLRSNGGSNSILANTTTTSGASPSTQTVHNTSTLHMNGQIPNSGNFSLTRNRLDLRQDNGLPNVHHHHQGSLNSLQNGLLGKCVCVCVWL